MLPLPGKIIVRANTNQKEEIVYGSLRLVVPFRRQYQENSRIGNPVLCEVVASKEKDIKEGDILVLGHNSITNTAWRISMEDGVATLSIPVDRWILGKLDGQGNLTPLFGNTICERITEAPISKIIINPFEKTEHNKVTVVSVAPDVSDMKPGDTAIIYTYADYEIFYMVDNEERSSVVVYESDVVAVAAFEYKGFRAKVSRESDCFIGEVTGIKDVIIFQGETVQELENSFHEAVDDYLNYQKEKR